MLACARRRFCGTRRLRAKKHDTAKKARSIVHAYCDRYIRYVCVYPGVLNRCTYNSFLHLDALTDYDLIRCQVYSAVVGNGQWRFFWHVNQFPNGCRPFKFCIRLHSCSTFQVTALNCYYRQEVRLFLPAAILVLRMLSGGKEGLGEICWQKNSHPRVTILFEIQQQ